MILTYRILINLLYPFLIFFIFIRKFFNKEDKKRYKEKIFFSHFNSKIKKNSKLLWFHAASIGEFKSIVPIVKELNKKKDLEFLITTNTLSSGNLASKEFEKFNNIHHRFFPLDVGFLIKKFLDKWRPNKIFLVDSEIWPNLILLAYKKKIPLALINARITSKTFNKWIKFPKTAKKIFNSFDLCLASSNESKNYLVRLQAKNIFFNGNIKFINIIDEQDNKNINKKFLSSQRFWLAASTHEGEDLFCLKAHKILREKYNNVITIIAPRHIDRANKIFNLSKRNNFKTQILNENEAILDDKEIIIINSFGVLQHYFKYSKSVFIGKSMLKKLKNDGGQNPIDAAKLGCKIYHGPYVYNFKEIYEILEKMEIAKEIIDVNELCENLIDDLKNPIKNNTVASNDIKYLEKKILDDTMNNINYFIQ